MDVDNTQQASFTRMEDSTAEHWQIIESKARDHTRAAEDGRDEEYVVCALIHDIGDTLGPLNHADVAAAIIKPFVSEKNHWMVANHAVIQGYYFFHHLGLDRNMRDKLKGHEYYDYTEEFCRKYDQNSFDPTYNTMSLDEFMPALESVLAKPKHSILIAE